MWGATGDYNVIIVDFGRADYDSLICVAKVIPQI